MRYFTLILIITVSFLAKAQNVNVLYDDFNGSSLNWDYWNTPEIIGGSTGYSVGWDPSGQDYYPFGVPFAWYGGTGCANSNNAIVSSGVCELRTTATSSSCYSSSMGGVITKPYSEGYIVSKQKYLYGTFEARIKIDNKDGMWPAFWLYGEDSPGSGTKSEIDIFEINAHWGDKFTNNYHWTVGGVHTEDLRYYDMDGGVPGSVTCIDVIDVGSQIDSWHTYKIIWTPVYIKYYFDGNLIRTEGLYNPLTQEFKLNIPMHIVLNNTVYTGENSWGSGYCPAPHYLATGTSYSSSFPASMYIDYVSVDAFESCSDQSECNYIQKWGSSGSCVTGQTISMGGPGCTENLNMTAPDYAIDRLELIASQEIILKEGFVAISEPDLYNATPRQNGGTSYFKARIAPFDCSYSLPPHPSDNFSTISPNAMDQGIQTLNTGSKDQNKQTLNIGSNSSVIDELISISVSPNPTKNGFIIGVSNQDLYKIARVDIMDINGRLIQNITLTGVDTYIDFKEEAGVYLIRFETQTGSKIKKLIKQ